MPGRCGSAAIVGGSMAGLYAAAILRRHGWDVDVYERNPVELAGRGAGIVTHDAMLHALEAAGLELNGDIGVSVAKRRVYACDGAVIGEMPFPQTNTSWDRLFQMLRSAIPEGRYHLGRHIESAAPHDDGVTLHIAGGGEAQADLVVAADGFRSTLRGQFLPEVAPIYAGYVAWRGIVDERAFSREAQAALFDCFAFCLPPGEQILGYPIAGPGSDVRPGFRRYNFVWYRPADEEGELRRLLTDDRGKTHDLSIPPPLIAKAAIKDVIEAARKTLAPAFAEAVALTPMPFFQPIHDLAAPRMALGRVALLGDAAFVARPHVGAGVTKAFEDGLALAQALAAAPDISAGLQAFERRRLPAGERIIERARRLGAYLQAQLKTPEERAHAERHLSPDAVMRDTATLDFL